jgi:hypothetical protein
MGGQKSLADVKALIRGKVKESRGLDHKQQLPATGKNEAIAKIISAMANTGGGTVVYGIEEDNLGRAKAAASPLVPLPGAPERIIQVAQTGIDEPVVLDDVRSLEERTALGTGFVVVEVPASDRSPHFVGGVAWGRAGPTTRVLSRREIGELFARSPGFMEEFSVRTTTDRPPNVIATLARRPRSTASNPILVLKNTGDRSAYEVGVEFPSKRVRVHASAVLPVPVLQPTTTYEVLIELLEAVGPVDIEVSWKDDAGENHSERVTAGLPYSQF